MRLFQFAHEKIGISRTYQFVSSMRQQLDPALDALIQVGFIKSYEYQGQGKGTEIIILAASGKPRVISAGSKSGSPEGSQQEDSIQNLENLKQNNSDSLSQLRAKLVHRGISSQQAEKLLASQDLPGLERIEKIISQFDYLVSAKSALISRNPVGFLYAAVQNPQKFPIHATK